MERIVQPELLDELPPSDPRAIRSRQDLRRINSWMGHTSIMARTLHDCCGHYLSLRVIELGAGDGGFLLRIAQRLRGCWRRVEATLVDRQDILKPATRREFRDRHWWIEPHQQDVFDWMKISTASADVVLSNLFLHHFHDAQLRQLLRTIAGRTNTFIALEPRRASWPLFCSRLLPFIGCNSVTRHDALISVKAGFNGRELSALWPDQDGWELTERPAGIFSHLFIAQRRPHSPSRTEPRRNEISASLCERS